MTSKRCYYEVLSVERTANDEVIKKSFRRLAMKCHPDRCPDDPEAQERFKEAKEAYEILADGKKRAAYDQYGHAAFENGTGGRGNGGFNGDVGDIFGDIFSDIFGMGGNGRGRARRGSDLRYLLELDLEEAVFGVEKHIEVPTLVACDSCDGSGSDDGKTSTCDTCRGHGRVRMQNGIFSVQQACPHCAGTGKTVTNPCRACRAGLTLPGTTDAVAVVYTCGDLYFKCALVVYTAIAVACSARIGDGLAGSGTMRAGLLNRENAILHANPTMPTTGVTG